MPGVPEALGFPPRAGAAEAAAERLPEQAAALQAVALRRTIPAALVVMLALAAGPEEQALGPQQRRLQAPRMPMAVAVAVAGLETPRPITPERPVEPRAVVEVAVAEHPQFQVQAVMARLGRSRLPTRRYR
jgi:hypothetical protein